MVKCYPEQLLAAGKMSFPLPAPHTLSLTNLSVPYSLHLCVCVVKVSLEKNHNLLNILYCNAFMQAGWDTDYRMNAVTDAFSSRPAEHARFIMWVAVQCDTCVRCSGLISMSRSCIKIAKSHFTGVLRCLRMVPTWHCDPVCRQQLEAQQKSEPDPEGKSDTSPRKKPHKRGTFDIWHPFSPYAPRTPREVRIS